MINVFFVHTENPFGDAIVELHKSELTEWDDAKDDEKTEVICALSGDDADAMEKQGLDCTDEKTCIEYARNTLGKDVPAEYNIIVAW